MSDKGDSRMGSGEAGRRDCEADAIVVGAGIAGASMACFMARLGARVVVLEREAQPGFHSTGRSAAMFIESYGPAQVRQLTRASRGFMEQPPTGFAAVPLLLPRGALYVASLEQRPALEALAQELAANGMPGRRLDGPALRQRVPVLEPAASVDGLLDAEAADIDVHALHQGFLRGLAAAGGRVACEAEALRLERSGGRWEVEAADGACYRAALLVDAAGAWADEIARRAGVRPLGLEPRRRSAFVFPAPAGLEGVAHWPCVAAADESFYLRPEARGAMLLGSPANADPVAPHDVQPEEIDVATGIFRIEQATTLRIRRPSRAWAGLRSFTPSGELAGGFAPDAPGFFWLAGQGGYGIQTAAAMGEACAHLALGRALPARLADAGVDAALLGRGMRRATS